MKNNLLLTVATLLGKVFSVLTVFAMVLITGLFVHWHISPASYNRVMVDVENHIISFKKPSRLVKESENIKISDLSVDLQLGPGVNKSSEEAKVVPLEKVSAFTLYYLYAQILASSILGLLILQEILKIIRSVSEFSVFRNRNVRAFRNLGFLCLGLSIVSMFSFFNAEGHSSFSFSIEPVPLLLMLGAFIMAEVFKEGNRLAEQDQLTI